MPHESIEAEFVYLPTPSPNQEEHHQLDQEGPLSSPLSHHSTHGAATYVRTGNTSGKKKSMGSLHLVYIAPIVQTIYPVGWYDGGRHW